MAGCVVLYGSGCLTLLCSGFKHRCTDGQTRYFVPTLAAFVGDIMAADTAFGILLHSTPHSDISILIHKSHLNDPEYEPEERTESQMVTVRLGLMISMLMLTLERSLAATGLQLMFALNTGHSRKQEIERLQLVKPSKS